MKRTHPTAIGPGSKLHLLSTELVGCHLFRMRAEDISETGLHTGSRLTGISPVESVSCADWPTSTSAGTTEDMEAVSALFFNPAAGHRDPQQKADIVGPIQSGGFLGPEIQKCRWARS